MRCTSSSRFGAADGRVFSAAAIKKMSLITVEREASLLAAVSSSGFGFVICEGTQTPTRERLPGESKRLWSKGKCKRDLQRRHDGWSARSVCGAI